MREEKHIDALREVKETIDEALNDPRGLLPRQRRIAAMLSIGMAHLIEIYLHKLHVIKPGTQLKHNWFKAEERALKIRLAGILTKPVDQLPDSLHILYLARSIEDERDDIVYGAPLTQDNILREKIDIIIELKRAVEKNTGEIKW